MADTSTLRTVVFRIGDLVCGIPASFVREVLPPLPATRIPGVGAAVEGLVNVRGALLTVVDGHTLLQRPRPDDNEDGAILMLRLRERMVGLVVTQVLDFLSLAPEAVSPNEELPGVDPRLVRAVGRWGEGHFILLDVETLLAPMLGG